MRTSTRQLEGTLRDLFIVFKIGIEHIPEMKRRYDKLSSFWKTIILTSLILNFGLMGLSLYFHEHSYPSWGHNFISGCFLVLFIVSFYLRFFANIQQQKRATKPLILFFLSIIILSQAVQLL